MGLLACRLTVFCMDRGTVRLIRAAEEINGGFSTKDRASHPLRHRDSPSAFWHAHATPWKSAANRQALTSPIYQTHLPFRLP